ncbi:glycosyltransferase [Thiohalomonas denitrificans]|uniref:Glycosyltransferase involved in cell wall bisynthesis n=1 Tax=Thiohalomonas denitrificans TaxID=415747 RepID=A0A1G5PRA8_9GAMM|nr:glycosyltransferase [Thiohalomonas denitrificans]SCZ51967.1 Glycosyltransferase involved in cell wall bisynthesis [Thiohalomonas denitrificans]
MPDGTCIKVLYVLNTTDRGERNMIIGLHGAGVDATVICRPDAPGRLELEEAGIRVIPIRIRSKVDFAAIRNLRQLLENESFSLVHVFSKMLLVNYTLASWGMRTPVVAYRGIIGNLSYWDPFSWLSFLNPRITRMVCVCEGIRQFFLKKRFLFFFNLFKPEKVVTIYKGHRIEWYQHQHDEKLLPDLGIPSGAKTIGCVARLKKRKGIIELIQAMELIPRGLGPHLVLVGRVLDKSIYAAYEKSASKDRIHLIGFHPEAARIAGEFDIITLPSLRREGLPRAVIEGMAQAIAPVVTDAGGSPELVEPGISGLVVPPGDPKALAEAFTKLLQDDYKRLEMGRQAQQRIGECFNVQQSVEKTLKLYTEILEPLA